MSLPFPLEFQLFIFPIHPKPFSELPSSASPPSLTPPVHKACPPKPLWQFASSLPCPSHVRTAYTGGMRRREALSRSRNVRAPRLRSSSTSKDARLWQSADPSRLRARHQSNAGHRLAASRPSGDKRRPAARLASIPLVKQAWRVARYRAI